MLKCIDLHKTYKPKKGVPVKALDGISLTFPDTGMIFLLGKSGSGKSTLLNVLGGLDRYDSGDIIIRGTSTKDFKQSHFDSYRNTYIGFIFQEYNILEEFTVGANIALAIELQDRSATDEEINRILKEVDLEGYGQRRPNELSGGQKQRVAIARALVKDPEIIFADEPTGALDSKTGKQVFDTLKKLSADHLVVVVSHDREFAEGYADRIIELSDGKVIDDVEVVRGDTDETVETEETAETAGLTFEGFTISVPAGYHLTEEDRVMINAYLDGQAKTIEIKGKPGEKRKEFTATDEGNIVSRKNSGFHLIRSKLPFKIAFRIGASVLKHKKIRLVFTILLSLVSFTLFALANTFATYDHVRACTDSIIDSNITYASVTRREKTNDRYYGRYYGDEYDFTKEEIKKLSEETGLSFTGKYRPDYYYGDLDFTENVGSEESIIDKLARFGRNYVTYASGFVEVDKEMLGKMDYKIIAGALPSDGDVKGIAVSKFICDTFKLCGYREGTESKTVKIKSPEELVGKKLTMNRTQYTVTGVVDTGFDSSRYDFIWKLPFDENDAKDILLRYAGQMEYSNEIEYSLCAALFVGNGFLEEYVKASEGYLPDYISANAYTDLYSVWGAANKAAKLSQIEGEICWFDGERTALSDDEIVVSEDLISVYRSSDYSNIIISCEKYEEAAKVFAGIGGLTLEYRSKEFGKFRVVGFIPASKDVYGSKYVLPDKLYDKVTDRGEIKFNCAVAAMPQSRGDITDLVEYCYYGGGDHVYPLQSGPTFELDNLNDMFKSISGVFAGIGLFFAIFASILFSTFIATSVAYKKQEIGILRAIGSRSNDVFRIFFSESFIIAMINLVLSSVTAGITVAIINSAIRSSGLLVTVLHFGIIQLLLLASISAGVAAIASFLPVKKIASKKPIDAIRNK